MPSLNTATVNSQADNFGTDFATASLIIYDGTPPANANTALSGNTALATHTLAGFGAASSGTITANAIADATIAATGTATFARMSAAGNVMQLTVGVGSGDLDVSTLSYVSGQTSSITSLTITQPAS